MLSTLILITIVVAAIAILVKCGGGPGHDRMFPK